MNFIIHAKNTQEIKGQVKVDVNIIRTVSGLALAVRCILTDSGYVGSCSYSDLCRSLPGDLNLNEENCPPFLINNGIQCRCPFNLPIRAIDLYYGFQLPSAAGTIFSFLSSGDYDLTIRATIDSASILCLNTKFTTKPV